jgi:hypothetical protein
MKRRAFCMGSASLGVFRVASGHDFHAAICDIQFNSRTGNTEIVQSYPMHDMDAAFWLMSGRHLDWSQAADEDQVRVYFNRNFAIQTAAGRRIPLRWVGVHGDADTLTVYQEIERMQLPVAASLRNAVLLDYFSDYACTVNVRLDGPVRTLLFNRKSTVQRLR